MIMKNKIVVFLIFSVTKNIDNDIVAFTHKGKCYFF